MKQLTSGKRGKINRECYAVIDGKTFSGQVVSAHSYDRKVWEDQAKSDWADASHYSDAVQAPTVHQVYWYSK